MSMNFNEESEKPSFIYKKNPLIAHSFQIFEHKDEKNSYEPVGEYTLINMDEELDITEKKVINLISIMNGRKNLIDFSNLTQERILFNILQKEKESDQEKIIFRTHNGQEISKENAILTIDKGVFHEQQTEQSG